MDKKAYIESKGAMCPFCRAESIQGGFIRIEAGKAFQEMGCTECEGSWEDVYQLVDVISIEKGEQKMKNETIQEIVDSALISGTVEAECLECGITIQCETSASTAWCEICGKIVKIKNPLMELGFI